MWVYLDHCLVGEGQGLLGPLLLQVHLPGLTRDVLPACQLLDVQQNKRLIHHDALALVKTGVGGKEKRHFMSSEMNIVGRSRQSQHLETPVAVWIGVCVSFRLCVGACLTHSRLSL